jgi:hypothetical protein
VHPVVTEPISAIAGRADLLSCTFFLLALLAYSGGRSIGSSSSSSSSSSSRGGGGGSVQWSYFRTSAALAFAAVSMLCKEGSEVTALLGCVVLEFCRCFYTQQYG